MSDWACPICAVRRAWEEVRPGKSPIRDDPILQSLIMPEDNHVRNMHEMQSAVLVAAAQDRQTVTLELPTAAWLCIIDEVKDRRPRNYSRLIADDTMDQFCAIAAATDDLLQEDVLRMGLAVADLEIFLEQVTGRPIPTKQEISDFSEGRPNPRWPVQPRNRPAAKPSDELRRLIRERGWDKEPNPVKDKPETKLPPDDIP